jgi:hypothetical protein
MRFGQYDFTIFPFGLINTPGLFMSLMHGVFHEYLDKFIQVFMDDILIYSRTLEEHDEHLCLVLVRKTGPRSNKIKQMQKQNTEDTQYKRDTDLRGSPSVGYVHQRNFRSFLYYYPANEGIQPTAKPVVTSSSFSHSLLSQNTIFTIIHSRNTFPS